MPCWQVQTVSLDLKTLNKDHLEAAIKSLGWTMNRYGIQTDKGTITINGTTISGRRMTDTDLATIGGQIKRQISVEIIKAAAARNKWGVVQAAPNKIVLRRS